MFPSLHCMHALIYALPLVHYQCVQIMLLDARDFDHLCIVLFYALIYTAQKNNWMFGTEVEKGWFYPSLSQVKWSTISQKTTTTTKNISQMCSPSFKCAGVVCGLRVVYSITIFSIDKHSAVYTILFPCFTPLGDKANLSKFSLPQLLGKVVSTSRSAEPCTQCQTRL